MEHTFLFKEGIWRAEGEFFNSFGQPTKAIGEARITHCDNLWLNDAFLKIGDNSPLEIHNRYEIVPFKKGSDTTAWISANIFLGKLAGRFAIVSDLIISHYNSEDGLFNGTEFMQKIDENRYKNSGAVFDRNGKLSSWSLELDRVS